MCIRQNCAFCHGLPLQAPSAASQGMFPHAPQLFTAKETVTDDPVGVTYWKVKNGIRLTGMPSFQKALSDQQMWQVSRIDGQRRQVSSRCSSRPLARRGARERHIGCADRDTRSGSVAAHRPHQNRNSAAENRANYFAAGKNSLGSGFSGVSSSQ